MNNELLAKIFTIIGIIVFVFILYVGIFVIFRPFDNAITVGRPITKALCEAQFKCDSSEIRMTCEHPQAVIQLEKWTEYKGCNNQTSTFRLYNGRPVVNVEWCHCEGIM